MGFPQIDLRTGGRKVKGFAAVGCMGDVPAGGTLV